MPSMPQEAVIIAAGLEASILWAKEPEENPPKTTAWMAPSLATASIANRAAGTIGTG